jgi:hypothetical protein
MPEGCHSLQVICTNNKCLLSWICPSVSLSVYIWQLNNWTELQVKQHWEILKKIVKPFWLQSHRHNNHNYGIEQALLCYIYDLRCLCEDSSVVFGQPLNLYVNRHIFIITILWLWDPTGLCRCNIKLWTVKIYAHVGGVFCVAHIFLQF